MKDFYDTPERVTYAGDWHGNTFYAVEAVKHAAESGANAIVHTGDFGYNFTDRFLDELEAELEHHQIHLGFVGGNHENYDYIYQEMIPIFGTEFREHINFLPTGRRWTWGDKTYVAIGGAHSVDRPWRTPGTEWWWQESLTIAQGLKVADGGRADVVISHDAPYGVRVPGIQGNPHGFAQQELNFAEVHRHLLRAVIDSVKPSYLFHGHYHVRYADILHGADYETAIYGLDCDGTPLNLNMVTLNLEDLNNRN